MALCDCDRHAFPQLPAIAPGLSRLPRQIGLFPDFRAAMLGAIRDHPALRDWRARDREDFGLMLLEWWAYVGDVIAFYNAEHAQDLYLATARDEARIRRVVGLLGYRPRPALAAEAVLAAIVDGSDPVEAARGARFISDAIDDTPPQEFELSEPTLLDPLRNAWTLAPIREDRYDPNQLLLDPATRNLAEDALFAIEAGSAKAALRVASITPETALDGAAYLRLEVTDPAKLPASAPSLSAVRLWGFTQNAPVLGSSSTTLTLNGMFPQIRAGTLAIIEDTDAAAPLAPEVRTLTAISFDTTTIGGSGSAFSGSESLAFEERGGGVRERVGTPTKTAPTEGGGIITSTTRVTLDTKSDIPASRAVLHFGRVRAGKLVAPAKTQIAGTDLLNDPKLAGRHDVSAVAGAGEVLLKGAHDKGARVPGDVVIGAATGGGFLDPAGSYEPFADTLRTPVTVHGNVLHVTRGKTVEETVGSGAGPGVPFQTFTLAKFPLTYLSDPVASGGRRSTLRLWIDGIEWREVESLFLAEPEDRVFTVTLDVDGKATITTGGDGFGLPAPLGTGNVFVVYRFGAGDPPPGANAIQQIAGPVPRLRRVFNPTPAFGGGPGDKPEDIRFVAPASAATFDRAVSAADFAALARDYGALAAVAVTEWVPKRLREGVAVTAILEGEASAEAIAGLEAHLTARAAETLPIEVIAATPVPGDLVLGYTVAADASADTVRTALETRFLDPFTGLLSPRRAAIGGPVFRSALLGAAAKVEGVASLLSLTLDGAPAPARIEIPAHGYFSPSLTLNGVTP